MARLRHWGLLVPPIALWAGVGVAVVVGAVAGLYPAARAARLSPTEALRSA
jgi:putative ABC transport system permease protein